MNALSKMFMVSPEISEVRGLDIVNLDRFGGSLKIELESRRPVRRFSVIGERTVCVREFDEGDAIGYLGGLGVGLYSCLESDLLKWFSFARLPLNKIDELAHYVLISSDTVIEWLSISKPTIREEDSKSSEP